MFDKVKGLLEEQRAKTEFYKLNKGFTVETVSIPEVPKTWEFFPGTKDLWCGVEYPENINTSGCLYRMVGPNFPGHKHLKSYELIRVINKEGKLHVYTPTWNKLLEFGDACVIAIGEPHLCVNKSSNTLLDLMWHPKLNGWEADYMK